MKADGNILRFPYLESNNRLLDFQISFHAPLNRWWEFGRMTNLIVRSSYIFKLLNLCIVEKSSIGKSWPTLRHAKPSKTSLYESYKTSRLVLCTPVKTTTLSYRSGQLQTQHNRNLWKYIASVRAQSSRQRCQILPTLLAALTGLSRDVSSRYAGAHEMAYLQRQDGLLSLPDRHRITSFNVN